MVDPEEKNKIGMPNKAFIDGPHLNRRHIDGPLLTWAGSLHWLTWKQRISLRFGLKSIDEVACEQWPELAAIRASLIEEPKP